MGLRRKRFKRGISDLLAIVIGLAIVAAVGISLYVLLPGYITSNVGQAKIAVDATARYVDSRTATLTIKVKNIGTVAVTISEIKVYYGGSEATLNAIYGIVNETLEPGQETSGTYRVSVSTLAPGAKLEIHVKALTSESPQRMISEQLVVTVM